MGRLQPYEWRRTVQFATAVCQRLPARTGQFTSALYERSARTQRWVFYDPDPTLRPFNTFQTLDLASDSPTIVAVNVTQPQPQRFRGLRLFRGWNYIPTTQRPLTPAPGAGEQPVGELFEFVISRGTLERIWWLDSRTREWRFFDPDPELAAFNTLSTVNLAAIPPVVVAVDVTSGQTFRGRTLFRGWNYIVLR